MLDWFENLLDKQVKQLQAYLNSGQIEIKEYDAAIVVLEHLQKMVQARKQKTLAYKIKSLFRKSA